MEFHDKVLSEIVSREERVFSSRRQTTVAFYTQMDFIGTKSEAQLLEEYKKKKEVICEI